MRKIRKNEPVSFDRINGISSSESSSSSSSDRISHRESQIREQDPDILSTTDSHRSTPIGFFTEGNTGNKEQLAQAKLKSAVGTKYYSLGWSEAKAQENGPLIVFSRPDSPRQSFGAKAGGPGHRNPEKQPKAFSPQRTQRAQRTPRKAQPGRLKEGSRGLRSPRRHPRITRQKYRAPWKAVPERNLFTTEPQSHRGLRMKMEDGTVMPPD
jgi:hypothetical protein